MEFVPDFDFGKMVSNLVQLAIAFALAFPAGWDREQRVKTIGVRTFPLVAMASCAFILLGQEMAQGNSDALSRVMEGTITGVGFLGGGAIVKQGLTVKGTATAAAIWTTAALGAAVAYSRYEIAVILAVFAFAILRFLMPLKEIARDGADDSDDPI